MVIDNPDPPSEPVKPHDGATLSLLALLALAGGAGIAAIMFSDTTFWLGLVLLLFALVLLWPLDQRLRRRGRWHRHQRESVDRDRSLLAIALATALPDLLAPSLTIDPGGETRHTTVLCLHPPDGQIRIPLPDDQVPAARHLPRNPGRAGPAIRSGGPTTTDTEHRLHAVIRRLAAEDPHGR